MITLPHGSGFGAQTAPAMETTECNCAVRDDFQNVATTVADWSPVQDQVESACFAPAVL